MTPEEVATSGISHTLREVKRVCEEGSRAVPITIVGLMQLPRESLESECKNAALFDRNTYIKAELVEKLSTGCTINGQTADAEDRMRPLKLQVADALLAQEKQGNEVF